MGKSLLLVWALTLSIFAGHNSDFRAFVAPQAAEAAHSGQSKATQLSARRLGGEGPRYTGHTLITVAPLQIYTAKASPSQVGAAQQEPFFSPIRRSYVSGVVWGLRGQPITAGFFLPSVWWEADGILPAGNGSALDVNRLEQGRIAETTALASAQTQRGSRSQEPGSPCEYWQRRAQKQGQDRWWKDEARLDFQIGATPRSLDGTDPVRGATATGAPCQYGEAVDCCPCTASARRRVPWTTWFRPLQPSGRTFRAPYKSFWRRTVRKQLWGEQSFYIEPYRRSRRPRTELGKVRSARLPFFEWLASILMPTGRPLGQSNRSSSNG